MGEFFLCLSDSVYKHQAIVNVYGELSSHLIVFGVAL